MSGLAWVVCVGLWGCGAEVEKVDTGVRDTGPSTTLMESVEATVIVAENFNNILSAFVTVETPEEATVAIAFSSEETAEKRTGTSAPGTTHEFVVVGMRHKTVYTLNPVVTYTSGVSGVVEGPSFETGRKPSGLPDMTVTVFDADAMQPGITIVGPAGEGAGQAPEFFGLDEEGQVVWYYDAPDGPWQSPDRDVKLMADGNLLLKTQEGLRVINLAGDTIVDIGSEDVGYGMHHDVTMLPNGNFMALIQEERGVEVEPLGGLIQQVGDGLLEITPKGEVVWEWWSFDHLDTTRFPTQLSLENERGRYDWTHANSVAYRASDASILVSFRHQDWVVKIDHATGEVLWRAGEGGDFTLLDGLWFSGQHSAYLTEDGRLAVYDNGNERSSGGQYSRGVIYQLDESAMTAQETFNYDVGAFTPFIGGHRVLQNGNSLLCAGGVFEGDPAVHEVSAETGEEVWRLEVEDSLLYRAQRLPSFWNETAVP
jgi:outer membrane protein assembly factor BamB